MRRNIALASRIDIVTPDTTDRFGPLEHDEVIDTGLAKPDGHSDAGKSGADDDDSMMRAGHGSQCTTRENGRATDHTDLTDRHGSEKLFRSVLIREIRLIRGPSFFGRPRRRPSVKELDRHQARRDD